MRNNPSVQEQHRASIQRNLHPTQPTASSSSSTRSSPSTGKRKAGPPRPFSNPAPALSSLDDFGSPPAPTTATVTFGLFPKVLDMLDGNNTLDPSPSYSWKGGDNLEKAQQALRQANLIFVVDVPLTGPIYEPIDGAFCNHCQQYNLDFLDSTGPPSDSPNTKPWVLTAAKGRTNNRTWVEDPKLLTRFTFTLHALRALPYGYTPNYLGQGLFVFLAHRPPTPLDVLMMSHERMAPLTPSSDDSFVPGADVDPIQPPSPGCRTSTVANCSYGGHCPRLDDGGINNCSIHARTPAHCGDGDDVYVDQGPMDLTLKYMPGSGPFSLGAWQKHIQSAIPFAVQGEPDKHLTIEARSINEAAHTLITHCLWLVAREPPGLKSKEILHEQFDAPRPKITVPLRSEMALFGLRVSA
ncbi:hypothetical protein C8R46DRAFT_1050366 [Mycena filopes]|nr:hypothetical protein C8R46DRAFT_1050366 [Mycena filopes]